MLTALLAQEDIGSEEYGLIYGKHMGVPDTGKWPHRHLLLFLNTQYSKYVKRTGRHDTSNIRVNIPHPNLQCRKRLVLCGMNR